MKYIRILFLCLFVFPFGVHAAGGQNEFMVAAQLLAAARNADINQVQILVNNGADINYVDATGLSLVCTALMNNDMRAAQILQMYGADASQCDRQIKRYNNRTKPKSTGGLFGGLSSVQSMTLAAAGAAVVVGGLLLLTDVLDPGNDNDNGNLSGGNRPGSGGGSDGNDDATAAFQLPIGPACSVDGTCPTDFSIWEKSSDFTYMSGYNYLMMAYAYNAFVRGYTGQTVVRLTGAEPFNLNSLPYVSVPGGAKPITVAAITANGANAVGSLTDKFITWADSAQITRVQGICNASGPDSSACQTALAGMTETARKFYNRTNMSDIEDVSELDGFDYSGHGTVFGAATDLENLNLKVIAGSESGVSSSTGDAYGFMPNGQLAVYRTGNGWAVDENVGTVYNAVGTTKWTSDDTFTLNGTSYTVALGADSTFTATDASDNTISGTVDGNVLNFVVDGTKYEAQFAGNVNSLKTIDVMNFNAMLNASKLELNGEPLVGVIANLSLNPMSTNANYLTAQGFHSLAAGQPTQAAQITRYREKINQYYNLNTADDAEVNTPDIDALALYTRVGTYQDQIIVNSAGAYDYATGNGETLGATFENYAPVLFPDLEHLFVTVVAVTNNKGTSGSIDGYASNGGKLQLSQWNQEYDDNGVLVDAMVSRKCGMSINGGLDPWCFAAPGATAEMAVASMAGAIGLVQSAFNQMKIGNSNKNISNEQLFTLLALTADGPYLGTKPGTTGGWASEADLISYLKGKYELPGDFAGTLDSEYLAAFKDVFGYGMINLERATRPGTKVYYYNGTNIVAADGVGANSYWRAATNTSVRASSVLNLAGARVSTAVFDMLESVDGSMRLPRVWESEFALGNTSKRGLYMGDVLGEFKTRKENAAVTKIGDMSLSMAISERAYVDNMGGLDNLSLGYENDNWNMSASYQRYFTDGASRFNGMANPILNLASNVVTTGAEYKAGNWSFGGRGYSGLITDESLLENDPTISAQFMPGQLGRMSGAESHVAYDGDKFGLLASFGMARESDTLLGAATDGLLHLGAGDTMYVDVVSRYDFSDRFGVSARATFARTTSDATGAMVLGLTDIESNAFAFGANIGDFEFTVARPLGITDGALQYAHAEYDVVKVATGQYDLVVRDAHVADLSLSPDKREVRFAATYRQKLGEFTDGALGMIYRVNPNHTDEFGNESIFMMKLSHRLGI